MACRCLDIQECQRAICILEEALEVCNQLFPREIMIHDFSTRIVEYSKLCYEATNMERICFQINFLHERLNPHINTLKNYLYEKKKELEEKLVIMKFEDMYFHNKVEIE